jgi:DNA-binding GntR family transcriptional regulator
MPVSSVNLSLSLGEQAFLQLRRDVLAGIFEPGAKLKIEELQAGYGYSSSPLREALNRLSQEGLVTADARRGFRVAPISSADLADITHMRLLLDVAALRSAIEHGDDAWEAGIVAASHRLGKAESSLGNGPTVLSAEWESLHKGFHVSLLAACPSGRQLAACASLFDQAERYRRYSASHRPVARNKNEDHRRLMDATLKRDADTACTLLAQHIRSTQKNVEAAAAAQDATQDAAQGDPVFMIAPGAIGTKRRPKISL